MNEKFDFMGHRTVIKLDKRYCVFYGICNDLTVIFFSVKGKHDLQFKGPFKDESDIHKAIKEHITFLENWYASDKDDFDLDAFYYNANHTGVKLVIDDDIDEIYRKKDAWQN